LREYRDLILPIAILTLIVTIAIYFRPLLILDETRYVSVAWEMFNSGNYFVPTLNNLPYDHKPPLLFWLINLDWHLFGVNETSIRFIPLLFSIGNIILSYKIYKEIFQDDRVGAKLLAWVIVGGVIYSFYTTLFMFDIMLSFWVLLSIYAGICAIKYDRLRDYALLAFGIGFGILAKSPVIVAHLLPLYLFASYWSSSRVKFSFYIKGLFALMAGIAIALIWAIPAAKMGGEAFAYGIFWGQYAGRAVNAFAHKHSFWWYLPWIPILLFPWILSSSFWSGLKEFTKNSLNSGEKFLIVWIVGTILIFSLISGKQIHYIAPEFLAFAIVTTRVISISKDRRYKANFLGVFFIILSTFLYTTPFIIKGYISTLIDIKANLLAATILLIYGIFLIKKEFNSKESFIKVLSLNSLILIFVIHLVAHIYLKQQNLTNFSKEILKLERRGIEVAHFGKYHNQYRFLGRLKRPLTIIYSKNSINEYIKNHPNGAIITYLKRDIKYNKKAIIAVTKFRTQNALLVKAKEWNKLLLLP